jgi:hypothetical protein
LIRRRQPIDQLDISPSTVLRPIHSGDLVGVVLFTAGIFWAISKLGAFGWVWTGLIGAITVFNAVRVVRSR